MHYIAWLTNGLNIRRPKKKMNLINETRIKACVSRFDSGSYNTRMELPRAMSHSVGAHTDALQPRHDASISDEKDADDQPAATESPAAATATTSTSPAPSAPADYCCEVWLIGQLDGVALVHCSHHALSLLVSILSLTWAPPGCPICRAGYSRL